MQAERMSGTDPDYLRRGVGNAPKKRTRFRNLKISYRISGFPARFQDFTQDFEISMEIFGISSKISEFQLRFRDFSEDFEISTKISGFQAAGNDR